MLGKFGFKVVPQHNPTANTLLGQKNFGFARPWG